MSKGSRNREPGAPKVRVRGGAWLGHAAAASDV